MKRKVKLFGAILFLLAFILAATAIAAPAPFLGRWLEPPRTGFDPLSPVEISQTEQLAWQHAALSAQAADRTEILLVERHQEAKAVTQPGQWSRRADLYLYNYDTDMLTRLLVNLESGAVETVESAQNVQLPLTPTETERAIQLVLADPQARTALSGQYQSADGRPLTNPRQQLDFHPLIFRAETMPTYSLGRAAGCGHHRCAQLLITAPGGYLFDLLPIVDLSRNEVVIANDK